MVRRPIVNLPPFNQLVNTPNRTTAAAFPRYLNGEILADSRSLQWSDLYVRHCRFPRVVDRFLVPATAEPHISCTIVGSAEFLERDPGGKWLKDMSLIAKSPSDSGVCYYYYRPVPSPVFPWSRI